MIKNYLIITLLLISFSTLQAYKLDCSNYSQDECCQNNNCWWDDAKECHNKVNCDKISNEECRNNKACLFTQGSPGHCDPIAVQCETKDSKYCLNNKLCIWNPKQICVVNEPQPCPPDCSKLDDKECKKNNEFCDSSFTCTDNKDYCNNLNEKQCSTNKGCSFTPTYNCVDNKKLCESYSDEQCKKNSKYCEQVQVQNGSCINKYDCTEFSCEECKKHEGACQSYIVKPFQCKNKKDVCGNETCEESCEEIKGCNWNPKTKTCSSCTNCQLFDKEACQANCDICNYTPEETGCQNSINCCVYSKSECKDSKYCKSTPPVYQCKAREYGCEDITNLGKCKENKYCSLINGKGKCTQTSTFGCKGPSALLCLLNKKCDYKPSCTDKKLRPCDQLNFKECQNSSYCHLEDCGGCSDVSFKCPKEEKDCLQNKNCLWTEGTDSCCQDKFDCSSICGEDCEKNSLCCLGDGKCRSN